VSDSDRWVGVRLHLSQQEPDAPCAMAMGHGEVRDVNSDRAMFPHARVRVPGVVIDDEFAL